MLAICELPAVSATQPSHIDASKPARRNGGRPLKPLRVLGANTNHCITTSHAVTSASSPIRLKRSSRRGNQSRVRLSAFDAICCSGCIKVRSTTRATPPAPTPLHSHGLPVVCTSSSTHQLSRSSAPSAARPSATMDTQRRARVSQLRSRATRNACGSRLSSIHSITSNWPATSETTASTAAVGQFRLLLMGSSAPPPCTARIRSQAPTAAVAKKSASRQPGNSRRAVGSGASRAAQ